MAMRLPAKACDPVSGAYQICNTSTFTSNNGTVSSWSVSPSGTFTVTPINSTSATVKSTGLLDGETGTLTVVFSNGQSITINIVECNAYISGPSTICDLNPTLYELHVTGADSWTINPNNSPIYVDYGSSTWAHIKSTSFTGETATLNAIRQGSIVASLPIQTCSSGSTIYGSPSICDFGILYVSNSLGVGGYWYIKTLGGSFTIEGTSDYSIQISSSVSSCGILYAVKPGEFIVSMEINTCRAGGGMPSYISVYPNPVHDILTIEIDAEAAAQALSPDNARSSSLTFDVRLYDEQGNLLRQTKTKGGTIQFNVSALPNGIYFLHVFDGVNDTPEMRQIVVEH